MTTTSPTTGPSARLSARRRAKRAVSDVARDLGLAALTPLFGVSTVILPRRAYPIVVAGATGISRLFGRSPQRELTVEQTFCRGYGLFRRGWPARVEVTGLDHFRNAHAEGRGVVMWLMGFLDQTPLNLTLADAGYPVCFLSSENHGIYSPRMVSRRFAAPILNRAVVRSLDRLVVIPDDGHKGYVRELCSILEQQHGTVGMKGDVTDSLGAVVVTYRGRPAGIPTGAASLAHMTGAPLLTGAVLRHDTLRHEVVIDEPVHAPRDLGRGAFVQAAVEEFARRLETRATAHPDSRPASKFDAT